MLQSSTIAFLKQLGKNNNKPWFETHRKDWERAKADFLQFTEGMIAGVSKFDPTIGQLQASKCTFRINRDVRFSKNKAPYKTNMGASLNKGGKKIMTGGYYFHLEPGNKSFVAGGVYMPDSPDLVKLRQEVDYNWPAFKKIITAKPFKTLFGDLSKDGEMSLSRPPKGYDAENPAIEYLKLKSFIVSAPVKDADLVSAQLIKQTIAAFRTMYPLIDFVNGALEH
jgi:uncharacterized protein (TIGR02453 family)